MKKKIILLAALLVVIIPFYNVKAITCRANIEVEYVNMDNLYTEETYITYDENDEHTYNYLPNTIGETNYVIYLSLIHISEPTRRRDSSRMPSSA